MNVIGTLARRAARDKSARFLTWKMTGEPQDGSERLRRAQQKRRAILNFNPRTISHNDKKLHL